MRPLPQRLGGGLEHQGDGVSAHGFPELDGGYVEAVWGDVGVDPAALGGVVGEVEGFEEDLVRAEGGEGGGFEAEGGVGAGEGGEGGGFGVEDPLPRGGWVGHCVGVERGG